jgi:hypothetical protein
MQNVSEMSRDGEMLFELVDGRPMPRLPRGQEVDGVTILTPEQLAQRVGGTAERWRAEWISVFHAFIEDPPAPKPATAQEAMLNILNRLRMLVDELEASVDLLHIRGEAFHDLEDAAVHIRGAMDSLVFGVIDHPPCDGASGELPQAIRREQGKAKPKARRKAG